MMPNNRILILGASGFIGSQVLKSFYNAINNFEIYVVEHHSKVVRYSDIKIIKGSLKEVPEIIESVKPSIIIHAARISGSDRMFQRKWASIRGGFFNQKIYNKVAEHHCKLVYISGSLMYGSQPKEKVNENFKINPISFAKAYLKAELPFVKNTRNAAIMLLRPGWVFGNDSWYKFFYKQLIDWKGYVPQYGDGQNCMSIIHVEDLGRLIKEYALNASYLGSYNLISPIHILQYEFVRMLSENYQKEIKTFSKEIVIQKYGRVIYDALSSDIHLTTNYTAIFDNFDFTYKQVTDLLN